MSSRFWCIGVSAPSAPIGVRESLLLKAGEGPAVGGRLKALGLADSALLHSCARFELFSGSGEGGLRGGLSWFDERAGRSLAGALRIRRGTEALAHLFRVAAGLESAVPSDPHVRHLIRDRYREACAWGMAGPLMHRAFQRALHVRTRIRQQARLSSRFRSFGEAAADILLRLSEDGAGKGLIVFGAGRAGEDAARRLCELGRPDVMLCGRDAGATASLAARTGAAAAGIAEGLSALPAARAALFACACAKPLMDRAPALRARRSLALTIVDAGLPRNVDPRLRKAAGILLHDLDDIHRLIKGLSNPRTEGMRKAEEIVSAEVEGFLEGSGREEFV